MTARLDPERLAVLVHEVRSPVAALSAIDTTFSEGGGDRVSRRELVRLALAACHAVERLVVDASPTSIRREGLDLGRLVEDVVMSARLEGARIEARIEAELPPVRADPVRLRQALGNLVSNAIVHAGPEARVTVSAAAGGASDVRLAVSDDGPGIAATDQARIFDPGIRLDAGRPGSGLGLAIVRSIVAAHGGRVTVAEAPGGGATFTILLPAGASL